MQPAASKTGWLQYSGNIARRILSAMEENNNMSPRALGELIDLTPEIVNKILKGNENLCLEMIAKLSEALGTELICFPEYKDDKPK